MDSASKYALRSFVTFLEGIETDDQGLGDDKRKEVIEHLSQEVCLSCGSLIFPCHCANE